MRFVADLADIRFGYGRAPSISSAQDADAMLDGVLGPDLMQTAFPIEPFSTFLERFAAQQAQSRILRKHRGTETGEAARAARRQIHLQARSDAARWTGRALMRMARTPAPFRERLVAFWADHFTAHGRGGVLRDATGPYVEDAIRPNIAGRFADLLQAAVMHPLMLHYLDQVQSVGPNSPLAQRRKAALGLNENLAREVLELHTLGVDGPYTQGDVRELAALFTGMSVDAQKGFVFRKARAEPGAETVLGVTYEARPGVQNIREVLEDLSVHPATAEHLARKLAVHFVSDTPNAELIAHMAARYLAADGDLMALYAGLLEHPSSWEAELRNVKPPIDFMASAFRALDVPDQVIQDAKVKDIRSGILRPLARMGQAWQKPPGPDGWEERDGHWMTPQGLAERTLWAMRAPIRLRPNLPDPRLFVETALGGYADKRVRFAASAAESRVEAIGLVLLSPAFQRR